MERTSGHLNGYSLVTILQSNQKETQYSQLYFMPVLIATRPKVNIENRPKDPKKAEEDLCRGASDCQRISYGGDGHDPYGAVGTQ